MSPRRTVASLTLMALVAAGCSTTAITPMAATAEVGHAGTDPCGAIPVLRRSAFPTTPKVNNKWLPLIPGTQITLDGTVKDDTGLHKHQIRTTITDLTKVMDGVRGIVVWDEDFQDGKLQESEIFFDAQDNIGNVWLLGEYPAEVTNGQPTGAPSAWFGGTAGSKPGITMQAHPRTRTPGYRQGSAPSVKFLDCAKTSATGRTTTVPTGRYHDVLVTDEWSPLDLAGGHQRKFYAPGIGNIRVSALGGGSPENLTMSKLAVLCKPGAIDMARAEALKLDRLAYKTHPSLYGKTPPAEKTLHVQPCPG